MNRLYSTLVFAIFQALPPGRLLHLGKDISNLVWESSDGSATIQLGNEASFIHRIILRKKTRRQPEEFQITAGLSQKQVKNGFNNDRTDIITSSSL